MESLVRPSRNSIKSAGKPFTKAERAHGCLSRLSTDDDVKYDPVVSAVGVNIDTLNSNL
jgi:hypothetical protein